MFSLNILNSHSNLWWQAGLLGILFLFQFSSTACGFDVVFRLDDPTLEKSNITNRVVDLFAQKQVPLSIAVIACNENECPFVSIDSSIIERINSGLFEVCIHGMNHQDKEFVGIGGIEAGRRVEIASQVLKQFSSNEINTFIPPFNAIDKSSLEEVKKFCNIVSSDMFTKAYIDGIDYYPETLGHMSDNCSVWNAASDVLEGKHSKNDICVIMFHQYDLAQEDDWNNLSSLLDYCKNRDSITLHTFSSLQESGNHSSWRRLKANQLESGLKKLFLRDGVLHSTWDCYFIHVINALLYTIISLLCIVLLCFIGRPVNKACVVALVIVSVLSFIIAFLHLMGPLKLLALVLFSCSIPIAIAIAIAISKAILTAKTQKNY